MSAPGERAKAKARGDQFYFTGKPCKKGHVAQRRVGNGLCVECEKAWFAENAAHRRAYINEWQRSDEHKAYMSAYYEANKERWKEQYRAPKEVLRLREAEYRKKNPEKVAAAVKRWHQAHPDAVRSHRRNNRAKRLSAPGTHTAADIRALFEKQGGRCAYCDEVLVARPPKQLKVDEVAEAPESPAARLIVCGCGVEFWSSGIGRPPIKCPACRKKRSPLPVAYHVDHDIPLARGGSNDPSNLCLACPTCNVSKQDLTGAEFRARKAA